MFRLFNVQHGLSASATEDEFQDRLTKVDVGKFPDVDYGIKMTKKILDKVVMPRIHSNGVVAVNQTTNMAESFNHVAKNYNDFKPHILPENVFKSENIVDNNRTSKIGVDGF